jgi:hypothetical protein
MTKKSAKGKAKAKPAAEKARASKKRGKKSSADAEAQAKAGTRGTAPWVARHAAKHAAEARERNTAPIPPGSARATLRVPEKADLIKQRIGELHSAMGEIRALRKNLANSFFALGQVLARIKSEELYAAKGYGSFEAFVERELDLGRNTSLALERLTHVFQQEAALKYGMQAVIAALGALDEAAQARPGSPLPLKPPGKRR